jgi:hypothetical protein
MSLSPLSTAARRIATFNALHLGDNLVHLHFLRALARRHPDIHFTHGAPAEHLGQLDPLVVGLPNLQLVDIGDVGQGAINAWRGAGGHWYAHPQRLDFVAYHLAWFRHLAGQMQLETPFHCAADLLFDYPALSPSLSAYVLKPTTFLLVNSVPQSGQWSGYNLAAWAYLAAQLIRAGHTVTTTQPLQLAGYPGPLPCTRDAPLSVTGIGRFSHSEHVRCIIGCVTGPMWPTLNIYNCHRVHRIHLLDHERVDLIPEHTVHTNSLSLVPELLRDRGLL